MNLSNKTELATHTTCRLGKWYYEGEGRECFSRLDGFKDLESPHKEVHKCGNDALTAFFSKDYNKVISCISKMEDASLKVIDSLNSMIKDGNANPDVLCISH